MNFFRGVNSKDFDSQSKSVLRLFLPNNTDINIFFHYYTSFQDIRYNEETCSQNKPSYVIFHMCLSFFFKYTAIFLQPLKLGCLLFPTILHTTFVTLIAFGCHSVKSDQILSPNFLSVSLEYFATVGK